MNGKDIFLGMNYIHAKYIEEAENAMHNTKKRPSLRRTVLIAAVICLMLVLLGCAVKALISLRVEEIPLYTDNGTQSTGVAVYFDKPEDVFVELGSYYPQQIPEGYTMTFVSDGAPLQNQRIVYENTEGSFFDFTIMIGDPASNVEISDIVQKDDVTINGNSGILYTHSDGTQTLVWIMEAQGYGFLLCTDDPQLDLTKIAKSTASGEPLTPTRWESTRIALEELGDWNPGYLPEGYEEQGVMGCPLAEGGGWYSYVRKYYVNKEANTGIFFEYETYAIDMEMGYTDDARTVCSFYIPGSDILSGTVLGEETEINGMYALVTGNHIAWANPDKHIVYHLTSEDVLDAGLLKVARSITLS